MRFDKHLQSLRMYAQHLKLSTASKSGRAKSKQSAAREMTVAAEGPKQDLKMQGI